MTPQPNLGDVPGAGELDRWRTYLGVALTEVAVILALWAFARYFAS